MLDGIGPLLSDVVASPDPGLWPEEGLPWVTEARKHAPGLDSLLRWASEGEASRIAFATGHPVWVRVHGRNRPVCRDTLDEAQIAQIANHLYGADGTARLQSGSDFDVSYDIPVTRSKRLRFRLNATPIRTSRRAGANIVLRPISDLPPSLEAQGTEAMIMDTYRPREGMVIVSGATGSGKSTLIAGMTMAKLADPAGHYNIAEGAAPVEFLLDRVRSPSSTISQTEVPRDLPSFEAFIRGCMRREPTDIIVGECRDTVTMSASIQAAISGHALTTTIHASDVPLTMQRIASLCAADERDNLITSVAQSLRLIVNQRLVLSVNGRRTALREILPVDARFRGELLHTPAADWPALTYKAVRERGQSYAVSIGAALEQGRISEEVAAHEMKEIG